MCCHYLLVQLGLLAYVTHGLFGGVLLALFLGVAEACATLNALNAHSGAESGAVGAYDVLVGEFEMDLVLCLLAPLDKLALEVVVLLGHLVDVDMHAHDTLLEEAVAIAVSAVQVDGPDERLESVARDEAIVRMIDVGRLDELYQPDLLSYTVEAAALHNLAAYGGEETLLLAWEAMIEDIADDGLYHCIAQILEAFVILLLLVRTMMVDRAVYQRLMV